VTDYVVAILAIIGAAFLVLLAAIAACVAWGEYEYRKQHREDMAKQEREMAARTYHRDKLNEAADWFSEHRPTYYLLRDLAIFEAEVSRENWRRRVAAEKNGANAT
jgi:hypothetical protein